MTRSLSLLALAAVLAACEPTPSASGGSSADLPPGVTEVDVAAGAEAALPRLSLTPDGTPMLSWSEPDGEGHALRFALWQNGGWGPVRTAATGTDWFINWVDTPGVITLSDGRFLAHWLPLHPEGDSPYAYDIVVSRSYRLAWSEPTLLNDDGLAAEHGFVSVARLADGPGVVWLDGRNQAGGDHGHGAGAMTLRFATLDSAGRPTEAAVLDDRTCDCCPTAMVVATSGPVVAYRDRSEDEIRDIAVVRHVDGGWTEPVIPHADDWHIEGCPVNGPALDAVDSRVALAWFTAANDTARVWLAVSEDGGATWGERVQIDEGSPVGRVGVALLENGDPAVSWLESDGETARFLIRRVGSGRLIEVARVAAARASGFPRIVRYGSGVLAAWTDPDASPSLRTATVSL